MVQESASKVDARCSMYIYISATWHPPVSRFQYPHILGVFSLTLHPTSGIVGRELTGPGGHREAVSLVMAQNAVNVTWDTRPPRVLETGLYGAVKGL